MSTWLEDIVTDISYENDFRNRDFSQFVSEVRSLLDEPEKWVKGKMCATRKGKGVPIDSPRAQCYCLVGAMQRTLVKGNYHESVAAKFFDHAEKLLPRGIVSWNDDPNTTHVMLMEFFDGLQVVA